MLTVPKNRRTKERERMRDERFTFFEKKFESIVESIGMLEEEIKNIKASKADVIIEDNGPFIKSEPTDFVLPIGVMAPGMLQPASEGVLDEDISVEPENSKISKSDVVIKQNGPLIESKSDMDLVAPVDSITPEILQEASEEDLTSEILAEPENLKVKDIKEDTAEKDLVEDTNE